MLLLFSSIETEKMSDLPATTKTETPSVLNAIRTETALSRFPCHRIARKGKVDIELKNQASAVLWLVDYSSRYGQPGPLAYKLDTLIINRKLDEIGRPVPKLLKLGSLNQISEDLSVADSGTNKSAIRVALLQNASAFITAKITYRATDGTERHLEAGFNRYAVVFTGETLPDGRTADAVYLIISDIYQEVLNHALTRPLDYEYMKALPPAAQRFYEIVSYQMYAALKYNNPRARLLYSEYCLLSTATRYFDFDHVKKQMYKTHKPHLESGYLLRAQYETTMDQDGKPDWIMHYTPGPNADREFQAFIGGIKSKRLLKQQERRARGEQRPLPFPEFFGKQKAAPPVASEPQQQPQDDPATTALIADLAQAGLNRSDAEQFARENPDESRLQLEYLPHVPDLRNRGAYLRRAIENGFGPPAAYVEMKEAEEARRQKEAEAHARKAGQEAQKAAHAANAARLDDSIGRLEIEDTEAFRAFCGYVEEERGKVEVKYKNLSASIRARMIKTFDTPQKRRELFAAWKEAPPKRDE